jgi:hypothetical protein
MDKCAQARKKNHKKINKIGWLPSIVSKGERVVHTSLNVNPADDPQLFC